MRQERGMGHRGSDVAFPSHLRANEVIGRVARLTMSSFLSPGLTGVWISGSPPRAVRAAWWLTNRVEDCNAAGMCSSKTAMVHAPRLSPHPALPFPRPPHEHVSQMPLGKNGPPAPPGGAHESVADSRDLRHRPLAWATSRLSWPTPFATDTHSSMRSAAAG